MEYLRGRTKQRYFTPNNRVTRNDRFSSRSEDRYVPNKGYTKGLRSHSHNTNYAHNTHPNNYSLTHYNDLYDPYYGTHNNSSSFLDPPPKPPVGCYKKHYNRKNKISRSRNGFTHNTATVFQDEQEMEFQVDRDPPYMRSISAATEPKRGFPGWGPRLTAPIHRSSHVLSFANHGGRFGSVNMSIRNNTQRPKRDRF